MSAVDSIKECKECNPQIENILLFVSDSLRWDYAPKSVLSRGVAFKTIASGIWTPISLTSMVTGLYPQHHGVHSFRDKLSIGISSILNLQGYNTSIWTENTWIGFDPPESSPLYRLLRHTSRVSLEDLEPPFIYLENEKGGHCPYGWFLADEEYKEWDCNAFYRDYGKKGEEMLRKRYQKGIERSVQEFNSRLRIIKERNLEDETLCIFLSDHGELLGEYGGIVGHGVLTAPEVVYVPTVFIHPNFPKGKNFEKEGVLRHVDLYPTICDILSQSLTKKADGVSLFNIEKLPDFGCTYFLEGTENWGDEFLNKLRKLGVDSFASYKLEETSVWDTDGGYLFREGPSLMLRLLRAIYITLLSKYNNCAIFQRERLKKMSLSDTFKNYSSILKYFCSSSVKYGFPSFSLEKARAIKVDLEGFSNDSAGKVTKKEEPLRDSSQEEEKRIKERLRSLGYV